MVTKILILILLLSNSVQADERKVSNIISWGTLISQITFDSVHSYKSNDRGKEFKQQLIRVGVTVATSETIKRLIHVERPDGSDDKSFWSEHSALAAASQGWNFKIGIPITIGTASGRVVAKKHRIIDVLTGAGIGTIVERFVH